MRNDGIRRWLARLVAGAGLIAVLTVALMLTPAVSADEEPVEVFQGSTERPQVALTFDCGPWVNPGYLNGILDALDEYGHRVTFFVSGMFLEAHGDLFATRMLRHEIANHSYSHSNFTQMGAEAIRNELRWTEEVANGYGATTRGMWRAPFGARTPRIVEIAAQEGYPVHVMWTADSGDWLPISAERVKTTVLARAENGSVIVQHCNSWQTAGILPEILRQLREWGMDVVTVSEAVR